MVSFVSAARDIARIREVSAVLIRHGFGQVVGKIGLGGAKQKAEKKASDEAGSAATSNKHGLRPSTSERIRLVLEELGPSFIKLGQIASTRPDLLPADLISELKKLQDSLPPLPYSEIREQLNSSLTTPLEELFDEIDEQPLATASIAQVHRAKLKSEQGSLEVVLKVQRPSIAGTIASDVAILHSLAALLEKAVPETRIYSPVGLIQQFDYAITAELDFLQEAENARRFSKNFADDPQVVFPQVHSRASSKTVICMEYFEGVKIDQAISSGHNGESIARLAFRTMIQQIYRDGFFHADPHPGNALIWGDPAQPTLGMIDLGMVGRLSPRMRDLTIDVVMAALRHDHEAIAQALYQIGTPTKKIDMRAYEAEVALLSERYLGKSLKDVEMSAMIRDLVSAATRYGIEIPADFVMMGKSLMTIEGVGKEIDPDFNVYEEARPLFTELLKQRYSPEKMGIELLKRLERLGGASYKVPQQVEEVLEDLRLGRLVVRARNDQQTSALFLLSFRLFFALIMAPLSLGAAYLYAHQRDTIALAFLLLAGAFFAVQLLFEIWRRLRPHKD